MCSRQCSWIDWRIEGGLELVRPVDCSSQRSRSTSTQVLDWPPRFSAVPPRFQSLSSCWQARGGGRRQRLHRPALDSSLPGTRSKTTYPIETVAPTSRGRPPPTWRRRPPTRRRPPALLGGSALYLPPSQAMLPTAATMAYKEQRRAESVAAILCSPALLLQWAAQHGVPSTRQAESLLLQASGAGRRRPTAREVRQRACRPASLSTDVGPVSGIGSPTSLRAPSPGCWFAGAGGCKQAGLPSPIDDDI